MLLCGVRSFARLILLGAHNVELVGIVVAYVQ